MARSDVRHNLTFEGTGTERGSVNHRESESVTAGLEGRLQSRSPPLPRGLPPHSWPLRPRSVPPPAKPFSPGASALWQSIFWSFTVTLLKPSFNSLPYGYYTKKKKKNTTTTTYTFLRMSRLLAPLLTRSTGPCGRSVFTDGRTRPNAWTLLGNNDVWIVLSLMNPSICLPHNCNSWQDANLHLTKTQLHMLKFSLLHRESIK